MSHFSHIEVMHFAAQKGYIMSEFSIRFVQLEPMRVASVTATAEDAEAQSWTRIKAWAEPKGLLNAESLRVFGFDNCQPHPNHQYTTWIPVSRDVQGDGEIHTFDFSGGWYAVTTVNGAENISAAWARLVEWLKGSPYRYGQHQGLEEAVGGLDSPAEQVTFHLYLPLDRPPQDAAAN